MNEQEIFGAFAPHYAHFVNLAELEKKPLLAHYTSLDSMEKIVKSREMWFSNPLFMNDLQEVRFGMTEGHRIFFEEFGDDAYVNQIGLNRVNSVRNDFLHYYKEFEDQHALNLYVFCLAQHEPGNNDGLLSMWRGYGGNGGGAAMVFNTSFVTVRQDSPILIGKVVYATDDERRNWIRGIVRQAKQMISDNVIGDDILFHLAFYVFHLFKVHSVMSKHRGFIEEQEWRIIYFPERDTTNILSDGFTYVVGKNGVEPKLRFPIKPLPFEGAADWTFESIVDRIVLGPSLSSVLAINAVKKMFQALNTPTFAEKVVASTIPYRAP